MMLINGVVCIRILSRHMRVQLCSIMLRNVSFVRRRDTRDQEFGLGARIVGVALCAIGCFNS